MQPENFNLKNQQLIAMYFKEYYAKYYRDTFTIELKDGRKNQYFQNTTAGHKDFDLMKHLGITYVPKDIEVLRMYIDNVSAHEGWKWS